MKRTLGYWAAAALAFSAPASAHEFWIDAPAWVVEPGEPLVANIRVGEKLSGAAYSYVPNNFRRFDLVRKGRAEPVPGRAGDRPALSTKAPDAEGLVTVVHVTRDTTLTYAEWAKFVKFSRHKDFTWALEAHKNRGLPETGFRERYSRYGKALVAVGNGKGQDRRAGLEVEIVAQANPYRDDLSAGLPVQVLYKGRPIKDAQVEVFEKAPSGKVTVSLTRTDARGQARVSVRPGYMYLVDHVVLRPLEPVADKDPVWESLWASLTFEVPERPLQ